MIYIIPLKHIQSYKYDIIKYSNQGLQEKCNRNKILILTKGIQIFMQFILNIMSDASKINIMVALIYSLMICIYRLSIFFIYEWI